MVLENFLNLDLFKGFTTPQLKLVETLFQRCRFPEGYVVFKQNQPATHIYILIDGGVEIRYTPYDGPAIIVSRLGPGDIFGWSAALGREVYTASVIAVKASEGFCISGDRLQHFCKTDHKTGVVLLERMAQTVAQHPLQPIDQLLTELKIKVNCTTGKAKRKSK